MQPTIRAGRDYITNTMPSRVLSVREEAYVSDIDIYHLPDRVEGPRVDSSPKLTLGMHVCQGGLSKTYHGIRTTVNTP